MNPPVRLAAAAAAARAAIAAAAPAADSWQMPSMQPSCRGIDQDMLESPAAVEWNYAPRERGNPAA